MRVTRRREGGCNLGAGFFPPLNTLKAFWSVSHVRSEGNNFMGSETIDYTTIIADLEAKKSALDAAINAFRLAQAIGALGQALESASVPSLVAASSVAGEVPAGAFLGKSIPEAAKLFLAIVKSKQTSRDIAAALLKGGIESRSKSFGTQVHSILDRASKSGSGIVKLDRSHWGLVEWYPAGVRAGLSQEKRGKRRISKSSKRAKKEQATNGMGPQATILNFMQGKGFLAPKDISAHTGIKIQTTCLLLSKLAASKKLDKSADGHFKTSSTV
jgi:hypothetical protein